MTVGELARRVLPAASEDEISSVVRQLRHWTVSRVFPDFGPTGILTGSGRHRGYDEASVPFVAVAVELGRWRLPMETIRSVLAILHSTDRPLWRSAMAGKEDIYLVVQLMPADSGSPLPFPLPIARATDKVSLVEILEGVDDRFVSALVISLSKLFARLR